jgi:hypothetical protein
MATESCASERHAAKKLAGALDEVIRLQAAIDDVGRYSFTIRFRSDMERMLGGLRQAIEREEPSVAGKW